MLFGLWTRMDSRNHVLDGGSDPPQGIVNLTASTPCNMAFCQGRAILCQDAGTADAGTANARSANVLFCAGTADAGRVALAVMLRCYHWLC